MSRLKNKVFGRLPAFGSGNIKSIRHRKPIATMVVLAIFLLPILSVVISTTAMGSQSSSSDPSITRDPETGAVTFLRSRQGLSSGVSLRTLHLNPAAAARRFLVRFEGLLGMPRSPDELIFKQKTVDDIGMIHIRLR